MTGVDNPDIAAGYRFMIYGATGYTGKLIVQAAKNRQLQPILAGRNEQKLKAIAESYNFEYRVVGLNQNTRLDATLSGIDVVLNAAGPYSKTANPLVEACLRTGTHYVDVTGEIPVFQQLQLRDDEARKTGIMIMPGVGFAVVPTDCLAVLAAVEMPDAHRLRIGISRSTQFSRGSANTMIELYGKSINLRRDGKLTSVPVGSLGHQFDFGSGLKPGLAVSWPDVVTAFHSTGIPNITTYFEVASVERSMALFGRFYGGLMKQPMAQKMLKYQVKMLPEGPSLQQRLDSSRVIVVEAENKLGQGLRIRMRTCEAYSFTAISALVIVEKILKGKFNAGFQTPAQVYGVDLLQDLEGVCLEFLT